MLNFIKNKLDLIRFIRRPLKIFSYTEVVKSRVTPDIIRFRVNVLNMDLNDISNGIKLMEDMGIESDSQSLFGDDLREIKRCYSMMQSGAFDPTNPYGCFSNAYAQYNPYSHFQAGFGNQYSNQYGQQQQNGYNPYYGGFR